MEPIITYLKETYDPLSIILYGSYADGSNNLNSDFDALVLTRHHEQFHDTSFVGDVQLDVFVYPASFFDGEYPCGDLVRIADGKIIMDSNDIAASLLERVAAHLRKYRPRSKESVRADIDWCVKMLGRVKRMDAEGMFRWHWVLTDSLEIFCAGKERPYFGPKKSLRWMQENHPDAFSLYQKALCDLSVESLENWIIYLNDTVK